MRQQAHRPDEQDGLERVVKAILIAILLVAVFVAWCSIPEPDLMTWAH